MSEAYFESLEQTSKGILAKYGEFPPPWILNPDEPPFSILWRMGEGEDHIYLWGQWWKEQNKSEAARLAYFQKWTPPTVWLKFVIAYVWEPNTRVSSGSFDYGPYFARLETLGFPSETEYDRNFAEARQQFEKICEERNANYRQSQTPSKVVGFWTKVKRAFRREPKEE